LKLENSEKRVKTNTKFKRQTENKIKTIGKASCYSPVTHVNTMYLF